MTALLSDTLPEMLAPVRVLMQRLSLGPHATPLRTIVFIAARGGEGTSTIAGHYAEALAAETRQKVLLVDAGLQSRNAGATRGIADCLMAGEAPQDAVRPIDAHLSVVQWTGSELSRIAAVPFIHGGAWKALLDMFDTLIIDAPPLVGAFDGVMFAARADAAVLVVEAEITPEPVVRHLRETLTHAGANVAGIVLNKRRHYIPRKLYQKL